MWSPGFFSYSNRDGRSGLKFAWSPDGEKWFSVADGFAYVNSDFGPWGRAKTMFKPHLMQTRADGKWHCIWEATNTGKALAYVTSPDLQKWEAQSYFSPEERSKYAVTISKTFHRSKGRDIITSPKTKKSNRTIKMPPFLCEEIREYIKMLYDIQPDERLFTVTKSYLNHEMERGAKQAGVKKIRVHDIRHSAVSLLIDMGFSVLAIGERMGHEAEKITYRYAHLFPTVQTEMAEKLEMERMTKEDTNGKNT